MRQRTDQPSLNLIQKVALKKVAIEAAHASGQVLRRYFRKSIQVSEKKGAGLVTNADLESQHRCVKILRKAFPLFGFLTEEEKPEKAQSPGRWIIDPLDGTTNFVHGFPMFCVSIAAEWNHEIVVGVIYDPILDETYSAIQGKGAKVNGRTIRISPTRKISDALLTTGFEAFGNQARGVRRPGSAALDLAYTARGVFDGFCEKGLYPWDIAAGALIVTEAGGKVTNFTGHSFDLESGELLVSNSHLHPALTRILHNKY